VQFDVQETFKINVICDSCWEKNPHGDCKDYAMQIKITQDEDDMKCFNTICKKCGNKTYIVLYYGE